MNQTKPEKNKSGNRRGMSEKSRSNLRPSRLGRPKKDQSILDLIRSKLGEECEYDTKSRTWLEALADAEMRMALKDTAARKDLFDRLMGKAPDQLELSGKNGKPLEILVRWDGNRNETNSTSKAATS